MGLELIDIRKSFGEPKTQVLNGISLSIKDGEFVSFVGRSGCGKSTLLYILSTLDRPTSGSISVDGTGVVEMADQKLHQFRNLKMGFVFQFHNLLPELTALENVLMPAFKSNRRAEREAYAVSLLKEFDLGNRLGHLPSQLSGGEQQRIAIARALVMEPKYLFADEPTGNLDSANGQQVMNLFKRINEERKMTVIFVTHDPDFAGMASRQIKMLDGKLI